MAIWKWIVSAASVAGMATPIAAQSTEQDVRCLMASNAFTKIEKDPAKKQTAIASMFFYLGRLDARLSPTQLKAQLLAQQKALNPGNLAQTMNTCAATIGAKQKALIAMGEQLRTQK